jgi:mannose-6-phosphate isomerase-like protein (cupin superfamily)
MEKRVKVVNSNTMEAETTKTGSRIKRLITKAKDGSDKITFSIGIIAGGIDVIESFESDTVYYMIEGKSIIEWDGNSVELTDGIAIYIPAGTKIRYRAGKDHKLISVFSPARI